MKTKDIKAALLAKRVKHDVIPTKNLLGSGSTRLNLACSGRVKGAYPKGQYVLLAGESDAGKTWLALDALAEAANDPEFDDYQLIYDPVEGGASMDLVYFFGQKLRDRIVTPYGPFDPDDPTGSSTVEDLYDRLHELQKAGDPFVYVVDSETALGSQAFESKARKQRKAREEKESAKGSMYMDKMKYHSQYLRGVRRKLRETGSNLVIISQLRQNVGMGAMFNRWTRPGGEALKYYADVEIWVHKFKPIKDKYKDHMMHLGEKVVAKVKRTRITGKKQSVYISIYHDAGIDDVGDNIDYLVEWKHWPKVKGGYIRAKELNKKMRREDLIQYIEKKNKESVLRKTVRTVWKEIEQAVAVQRKPRYG